MKHSVFIGDHKTSISVEKPFYDELRAIARRRDTTIGAVITDVADNHRTGTNLSSAVRVFVLRDVKARLAAPDPQGGDVHD